MSISRDPKNNQVRSGGVCWFDVPGGPDGERRRRRHQQVPRRSGRLRRPKPTPSERVRDGIYVTNPRPAYAQRPLPHSDAIASIG